VSGDFAERFLYKRHKASLPRSAENSPEPLTLFYENEICMDNFLGPMIQAGETFTGLNATDLI